MTILSDALKTAEQQYQSTDKGRPLTTEVGTETLKPKRFWPWLKWTLVTLFIIFIFLAGSIFSWEALKSKIVQKQQKLRIEKKKAIPAKIQPKPITPTVTIKKPKIKSSATSGRAKPLKPKTLVSSNPIQEKVKTPKKHTKTTLKTTTKVQSKLQKPQIRVVTPPISQKLANKKFMLALTLLNQNRANVAFDVLTALTENQKLFITTLLRLVRAAQSSGAMENANVLLLQGLQIFPKNLKLVTTQAKLAMQQLKPKKAIAILSTQTPNLDQHPNFYSIKALAYLQTQQFEKSLSLYQALNSKFPMNPNYTLGMAICYQQLKQDKLALSLYQMLYQSTPPTWASHHYILKQLKALSP